MLKYFDKNRFFKPQITGLIFVFIAIFLAKQIVQSQKIVSPNGIKQPILLKPSTILEDLENHKKNNPQISNKELADFANSLLPQKGFNFDISICDLIRKKLKTKEAKEVPGRNESTSLVTFSHLLTLTDLSKKSFQIFTPNHDICCCGYCYTEFPVLNITAKQMTVVAEGTTFTVTRTPELSTSEEYALVDNQTMLKEIRKWQVPYEGTPLGISEDGKKLFAGVFSNDSDNPNLVLEISEDGSFKFAESGTIKTGEGVYIENHPKEKDNDYLRFMRFNVGNKTYIIKFSGPCT